MEIEEKTYSLDFMTATGEFVFIDNATNRVSQVSEKVARANSNQVDVDVTDNAAEHLACMGV